MQKDEPLHWIHTRRSIRKYTDKAVPDSAIEEILRAAMYAPSAVNRQPWHFIVVSDREMEERKRRFSELFGLPEHVHPFALVSLGYASEEKSTPERFRPERIHYNTWGNK
jgi:nitroreductase